MTDKRSVKKIGFIFTVVLLCTLLFGAYVINDIRLDGIRESALTELDTRAGDYDESTIVLYRTSKGRAESLARKLDATLRITDDGSFATLTLKDGLTVHDIYEDENNKKMLSEFSIDYKADIADVDEISDEIISERLPQASRYTVSDELYPMQTYLNYMNMDTVWSNYMGNNVTVAVIDTGIDTDHPEFAGKISEYSYNATEDKVLKDYTTENGTYDYSLIEDEQGHGTAVAGVIAAGMNGSGITGIAPNAQLLVIKAECDANGTFARTSDLVFGLYYAIERQADVVNMSFGTTEPVNPFAEATHLGIDNDIIMVAAAGNEASTRLTWPAADENVIGVGALKQDSWELADYSNYGDNVQIVAPGTTYTTLKDGVYGNMHGTSLASPAVAGTLALMEQQNKYVTVDYVKEVLYASAYDIGSPGEDWMYGYGAIDASALLIEEKGTVTFNMQTDELENTKQIFIREHTLQDIPEPERLYAVFDGWYYDEQCTEELQWCEDVFSTDLTLYAKWANEDDSVPYTCVTLDDGSVEIRSYTGHRRFITIPDKIDGKVVSSIGVGAFSGESRLRNINLPQKLKVINENAFSGCTNLLEIRIPETVTTIGKNAFAQNARLSAVLFDGDSKLTTVGDYAFTGCSRLMRFEVPKNLRSMNGSALFGTTSLTAITVRGGNDHFASKDGVLFNKTGTTLVAYPAGLKGTYTVPDSVRTVGNCAFGYTRNSSVNLNKVVTIGNNAFQSSMLEKLNIPDTVTSIGISAFSSCEILKDVTIGDGLTTISGSAFALDHSLTEIVIPDNISNIDASAFAMSGIATVEFEENSKLTVIGREAFFNTPIESIDIPSSVMIIGDEAFKQTYNLKSVTFGENSSLDSIGSKAFALDDGILHRAVSSLTKITLPDNLRTIGSYAFRNSGLTDVNIPASVEYLGGGAFASSHNLIGITVSEGNKNYVSTDGVVYSASKDMIVAYPAGKEMTAFNIPDTVRTVGEASFYGSYKLTNITIPSSVEFVEAYGFYDCQNVNSYNTANGLVEIKDYGFAQNIRLTYFSFPDSIMQIGRYSFSGDYSMTSVNISDNAALPRLSYAAFTNSGLTSFRIPSNVSTMAQGVFEGCENLTNVTFARNSKLDIIPAYLFDGCSSITSITFEQGTALTSISAHGFEGMRKLQRIDFADAKITSIGNYAFRFCENLATISVPETLVDIGRSAFYGCKSLDNLTLPVGTEHIGSFAFHGAENLKLYFTGDFLPMYLDENWDEGLSGYYVGVQSVHTEGDWQYAKLNSGKVSVIKYTGSAENVDLTSLSFGADIVGIGGHAFYGTSVRNIILPDTLTSIQAYTFSTSKLESIAIPASVTFIGREAFSDTPLNSISFAPGSNLKVLEQSAFARTKSLASITLPKSLTTMGSRVFYESGLINVTFEDGILLKEIPEQAFAGSKLTGVTIPDSVKLINHNAFRDISSLTSMSLGAGEDLYIGSNVFYNTGLTSVYIPANVGYIGEYAFVGLESLDKFEVSADNAWYSSQNGLLMSKDGRKLIAVPAKMEGVLSVPSSVEVIGFGAFENTALTAVNFPSDANILTLGYRAFYNAKNIAEITIPASVVSIDYYAFAECHNLKKVTFAEGNRLTGIYEGAFYNCTSLSEIALPDTIIEISEFSFYGCTSLDHIPVSETSEIKGIYDYAFAYSGIGDITLPGTLSDIGSYSFAGIRAKNIVVPSDNQMELFIELGAFADCGNLEEITLPFIGLSFEDPDYNWIGWVFGAGGYEANRTYVPQSLKTINIDEGETELEKGVFYGLDNLTEINLPHSIVAVELNVFDGVTAKFTLTNDVYFYGKNDEYSVNDLTVTYSSATGYYGHLSIASGTNEIPEYAFAGWGMESLSIPDTVSSIGGSAFVNCSKMEKMELSHGLRILSENCFSGCSRLKNISIPESVEVIKESVLSGCSSLRSVKWPSKVPYIPNWMFAQCSGLLDVEMPNSIESIGDYAFSSCTNLKSIVLPDSVKTIGLSAFDSCISLKEITLGSNLCEIGDYVFRYASGPYVINNHSNLILIPGSNDYGEIALYARKITNKTGEVLYGEGYFESGELNGYTLSYLETADGFMFLIENGEYTLVSYLGDDETVTLPLNVNGYSYKIKRMQGVVNVVVPDGITALGYEAFADCKTLRSIYIPSSVKSIDVSCFSGCSSLEQVTISDGVEYISMGAFNGCLSLTEINLPNSVRTINGDSFSRCINLEQINIEPGNQYYKSIDGVIYDFALTRAIVASPGISGKIVIPETVKIIEANAFQNRTGMTNIVLPDGLTTICGFAFEGCTGLSEIKLPSSLTNIDQYAFKNCTGLTSIVIPGGVKELSYGPFSFCENLKTIILSDGLVNIGMLAFYETAMESIVIPDSVTMIGDQAFSYCSNLKSIKIPDSVRSIGSSAFSNCVSLEIVELPVDLESISNAMFSSCDSLSMIDIPGTVTSIGHNAFWSCNNLTDIKIPDSVSFIGTGIFSFCGSLREMTIGKGVKEISTETFYNCSYLSEITIGENITSIADGAFAGCDRLFKVYDNSLLNITCGDSRNGGVALNAKVVVRANGEKLFAAGCEEFDFIDTEDGFRFIKDGEVYKLIGYFGNSDSVILPSQINGNPYEILSIRGIRNLTIPDGILKIYDRVFSSDYMLENVTINSSCDIGEYCFSNCINLKSAVINGELKLLNHGVFYWCTNLENVILPQSIEYIANDAFLHSSYITDLENYDNGVLYAGNNVIKFSNSAVICDWNGKGTIADGAVSEAYALKQLSVGGNLYLKLYPAINLDALLISEMPSHTVTEYFTDGWNGKVPVTLDTVIIKKGTEINRADAFKDISDITIFVEDEQIDVAHWDNLYPGWNNGNKVYYGDEWITACFYDADGELFSREYYTNAQVIRQPHVSKKADAQYEYELVGWDTDGDGKVDRIPATSSVDISAKPVFEKKLRMYNVVFYDKDGVTELSKSEKFYGDTVTLPDITPAKKGYTFSGWAGFTEGMTVDGDVKIYSSWTHDGEGHVYSGDGVWVDATCDSAGYYRHSCTVCDEWYGTGYTTAKGHSYKVETIAAKCNERGYDKHTCETCGDEYRDNYTPKIAHEFTEWVITKDPTCSEEGEQTRYCKAGCAKIETERVSPKGHEGTFTVTKEATCLEVGEMKGICKDCGHEFTETIPKTDHAYSKQAVSEDVLRQLDDTMPDMLYGIGSENGYYLICDVCGDIQTEEGIVSAQSSVAGAACTHTDAEWTVAMEATCGSPEVMWKICALCGKATDAKVTDLGEGKSHDYKETSKVLPTCTEQGYTAYTCNVCGTVSNREYVQAIGHDYKATFEWSMDYISCKVTVKCKNDETHVHESDTEIEMQIKGDCTVGGAVTYYATAELDGTVFKDEKAVTVKAGEHVEVVDKAVEATCTSVGLTEGKHCMICGAVTLAQTEIPVTDHTYGEWITDREASEAEDGLRHRICTVCAAEEQEIIEYVEYVLGDVNGDGKVNALDATQILRYANNKASSLSGCEEGTAPFKAADVTGDGKINALDATQILRFANNKPSALSK